MPISLQATPEPKEYPFIPAGTSDRRSPCPALNALANHGYLPRHGTQITFMQLLHAIKMVYNLSLPLALLLTLAGFLTCGKLSISWAKPKTASKPDSFVPYQGHEWGLPISWTLSLSDLSARGWNKIAHDASLVHPSGIPSHAPDPILIASLLSFASDSHEAGLTLDGLAAVHAQRERTLPHRLGSLHEQVACGECALAWLVMGNPATGVIDLETLEQWFGDERLPDGWWNLKRPTEAVGLIRARKTAGKVQHMAQPQLGTC
ncbi:HEME-HALOPEROXIDASE domain-containing protein [Mycena sanguinolenta]|uniref:HEME-HALOPEROXIDASE domain-containing protein n=1 Tax=Mycena sanguinolenta TaxID=230812 RepID=A0A8H7DG82_9AGAR|nr:HEME-HALOPEROXIDASE domain-containing protein [Mycena sanguinolenta]